MNKDALYYVIFVASYSYCGGQIYQKITNRDYKSYINKDGNVRYKEIIVNPYLQDSRKSPYYPDYSGSYYKFKTYDEAYNMALELRKNGVLPNLPISNKIAEYGNTKGVIAILKRPLGDVIGYRYAKWVEANQDQIISNKPKFKAGDIVYLTNIGDGDIIYKTKVYDCELDDNDEWTYFTTYWSEYPYTKRGMLSQTEFVELYKVEEGMVRNKQGQLLSLVEC